jgi:hypothetical protein
MPSVKRQQRMLDCCHSLSNLPRESRDRFVIRGCTLSLVPVPHLASPRTLRQIGIRSDQADVVAEDFSGCSGRKGCRVGGKPHHVVEHQVDDIGCHQRAPGTGPRPVLKVIELPHEITRRPSREAGDRSYSVQLVPHDRSCMVRSCRCRWLRVACPVQRLPGGT